eukprot:TRINITY_DN19468_c0_g1_i1.p1 TRINITY_DN19468_c0_g1~~TRINITY_DN19468_c0_g1_i1.p1  ORF type:complete len:253 (+),score=66.85 TRINITY_DN19468_c0_g1_i1:192-950(+)
MSEIQTPQEELQEVFEMFDTDKSGEIDLNEFLYQITTSCGMAAPDMELFHKFWARVDTDGSGGISFNEFCNPHMEAPTEEVEKAIKWLDMLDADGKLPPDIYKKKKALVRLGYNLSPEVGSMARLFAEGEDCLKASATHTVGHGPSSSKVFYNLALRQDQTYQWSRSVSGDPFASINQVEFDESEHESGRFSVFSLDAERFEISFTDQQHWAQSEEPQEGPQSEKELGHCNVFTNGIIVRHVRTGKIEAEAS